MNAFPVPVPDLTWRGFSQHLPLSMQLPLSMYWGSQQSFVHHKTPSRAGRFPPAGSGLLQLRQSPKLPDLCFVGGGGENVKSQLQLLGISQRSRQSDGNNVITISILKQKHPPIWSVAMCFTMNLIKPLLWCHVQFFYAVVTFPSVSWLWQMVCLHFSSSFWSWGMKEGFAPLGSLLFILLEYFLPHKWVMILIKNGFAIWGCQDKGKCAHAHPIPLYYPLWPMMALILMPAPEETAPNVSHGTEAD